MITDETSTASPSPSDTGPPTPTPTLAADNVVAPPEVHIQRWIPLGSLHLEYKYWENPRSVSGLSDEELQDLADSIRAGTSTGADGDERIFAGINVALEVIRVKADTRAGYIDLVTDGQRRVRACLLARLPDDALIPVIDQEPEIVEMTPELAAKYTLRSWDGAATRKGLSSYEITESAERIRNTRDPDTGKPYTLARISASLHRSESWLSKMLAARKGASPKLLLSWKMAELTDEQFKDLAAVPAGQQKAQTEAVVSARKGGDLGAARTQAREQRLAAVKAAKESAPPKPAPSGKHKAKPESKSPAAPAKVVRGPQGSLPVIAAPARKPPSFAVVEDFLQLSEKRPPTHEYVQGLMDGARWASGLMDAAKFRAPWAAYIARVHGGGKTDAKSKKKSKAKR